MLSFDISDRQVHIVKGDNSAGKIRIEKSLSVDVPEEMIMNGEVINLSGLADLLVTNLKAEVMMDRDAIVTFSSSNIVFKELTVPKAKGNEFLQMVQNHMSQEMGISDEYSISYTVVGEAGEDNPGAVKVLATACPSAIVEAFRKLFNIMSINLKSVNISCNSISRIVLADKSNMEKMPLLVCQLDDNFIGLTLFENGQMAFARYVPIDPSDYDQEDYVTEALNENIFRMEQFNKARGGPGLDHVILYGKIDDYIKLVDSLDGMDIKASILGVPAQITGYENFEFTVFANAIGSLYRRNKQTERINLLEIDTATGKTSEAATGLLITAGIVVAASALAIGAITLFIGMRESSVRKDIDETNEEIRKADEVIAANQVLHKGLDLINQYKTNVENAKQKLDALPVLKKKTFEQIDEATSSDTEGASYEANYTGLTYDQASGLVAISDVHVGDQYEAPEFIRGIKDLDYFSYVTFGGYTGTGTEEDPVTIPNLQLYLKPEEVTE
ncbi:MAG: pilus assembly protein PilM [Ruminococcus sp.]|nr:pilus assembly protein PilM [Ruminococcus sp.]